MPVAGLDADERTDVMSSAQEVPTNSPAPDDDPGRKARIIAEVDRLLHTQDDHSPWLETDGEAHFDPDLDLLSQLITVPVREGASTQTGILGKALDAWFAQEFRRAGFEADLVWPRPTEPRVLPPDIASLLSQLSRRKDRDLRGELTSRLAQLKSVAPRDANILGRAYVKQVDVVMSSWQTGPELLLSTKSMSSSFGKNLANRFEEAYGDAENLRARHPLAAVGFAFVTSAEIFDVPAQGARAVDMMYKLRDRGDGHGYTSTTLICFDRTPEGDAVVLPDVFPEDLRPGPFIEHMIDTILVAAPASRHERVRQLRGPNAAPLSVQ